MDFACFQVWKFSEKHVKTTEKNHEILVQNSLKTVQILLKSWKNSRKTISKWILKLPSDKKSKNEPKHATKNNKKIEKTWKLIQNSIKDLKHAAEIHNKLQETIPQSILKLPRDKKHTKNDKIKQEAHICRPKLAQKRGPLISSCEQDTGLGQWGRVG